MRRLLARTRSVAETRRLGVAIGEALDRVPRAGFVIVLNGDLGAGKTVLAGGLVLGLGAPAGTVVQSPTFTVARGYRGRAPIVHMDAYQIRSRADLEAAGFEEMGGEGRVTVVEWGDRIAAALPADRLEVTLTTPPTEPAAPERAVRASSPGSPSTGDAERALELVATGPASTRVLERLVASHARLFAAATAAEPRA
jgi:tRNA threonylcarbamoyl adenosine modification protein YjeE